MPINRDLGTVSVEGGSIDSITDAVTVADGGNSITIDGTLTEVSNVTSVDLVDTITSITNVVSVDDNGGSLTVDGSISVSNFPSTYPVTDNGSSLTVDDGGSSLTVDGSVSVSNFPASYPVTDNGGSLTVDGSVSVSNFPVTYPVTDNGGSLTVDGAVSIAASTNPSYGSILADAWGVLKTSHPESLFHGKWTFDIDPANWFMYENGTQVYTSTNITSTNSAAKLVTDVTNTSVMMESRECPRYQANRGHLFSTALWCPSKTNDGKRRWGLITAENGVYFELRSDGLLYAMTKSGSSVTTHSVIDTSGISGFDVEKGNLYDIQFQWRGVGNYYFYINQQLVYTVANLGTLTALSIENPALPVCFECERTTADVEMHIGCVDVTSENGSRNDREVYTSAYAENVSISTNTPVIVVKCPLTISSETNTRTNTLAHVSVFCDKKAVFKLWTTRTAGDITGATYQPVGGGSYTECDSTDMSGSAVRATSVTVANLNLITSVSVAAGQTATIDNPYRDRIEFPLVRGDYLVITGSAATGTAEAVVEWGEQRQ